MKTAISVPNALNDSIETFLQATRMSRSEFFQKAARAYLEKASAKAIVANLDQVYGNDETPEEVSFRQAALAHFREVAGREEW